MERIQLYQKDTIKLQGAVFTDADVPVDLADKTLEILVIDERNNSQQIDVENITIENNTFECEISEEVTKDLLGNYLLQITIIKDEYSVREIRQFINVKKSF